MSTNELSYEEYNKNLTLLEAIKQNTKHKLNL